MRISARKWLQDDHHDHRVGLSSFASRAKRKARKRYRLLTAAWRRACSFQSLIDFVKLEVAPKNSFSDLALVSIGHD
jgi:hypothetical protein